jgi:tetratricopeptide (TPR) repeat protein
LADLLGRGRYKDAEDMARTLLAANGREAMAWAALGDIARAKGELTAAAKHYAFAVQYDPGHEGYLKSHLAVVEAMKSPTGNLATHHADSHAKAQPFTAPLAVLGVILLCVFCWVVMDRSPLGLPIAPLSGWTMAALAGLMVCGLALGACLSLGDIVDRLFVAGKGAVSRTPPVLVLGAVSVLNFWIAALLYVLSGVFQGAFQKTTSALVAGTAGLVLALALAGAFVSTGMAFSIVVFGGSLVYAAALLGWATADALRR